VKKTHRYGCPVIQKTDAQEPANHPNQPAFNPNRCVQVPRSSTTDNRAEWQCHLSKAAMATAA